MMLMQGDCTLTLSKQTTRIERKMLISQQAPQWLLVRDQCGVEQAQLASSSAARAAPPSAWAMVMPQLGTLSHCVENARLESSEPDTAHAEARLPNG